MTGDRAWVRSVSQEHRRSTKFYEYRLTRTDGEWRISRILKSSVPPGTPLIDRAKADRLLGATRVDALLSPSESNLRIVNLFTEGQQVMVIDEPAPLKVTWLGEITCASGVLAVADLGWVEFEHAPLIRRIPAGTYPVDVAAAGDTNVALRLRLSDAPTVSWHPADNTDGTHMVEVEAGNVAIVDFGSISTCEVQHVEELYEQVVVDRQDTPGTVFSLTDASPDAVVVTSGYGDGSYPCYWGVAVDGSLTELVVDFLVLADERERTVSLGR